MAAPVNAPADLEKTLAVLRVRREEIRRLFLVEIHGVVGSVARRQARPDSDVDILSDWLDGTTLLKVGGAMCLLEDELHRPVQLIDRKMLGRELSDAMTRDFVAA